MPTTLIRVGKTSEDRFENLSQVLVSKLKGSKLTRKRTSVELVKEFQKPVNAKIALKALADFDIDHTIRIWGWLINTGSFGSQLSVNGLAMAVADYELFNNPKAGKRNCRPLGKLGLVTAWSASDDLEVLQHAVVEAAKHVENPVVIEPIDSPDEIHTAFREIANERIIEGNFAHLRTIRPSAASVMYSIKL